MKNKQSRLTGNMLQVQVKSIKKSLPKACTFLSTYKDSTGEILLKAVVRGTTSFIRIPQNSILKPAELERVMELLKTKCYVN